MTISWSLGLYAPRNLPADYSIPSGQMTGEGARRSPAGRARARGCSAPRDRRHSALYPARCAVRGCRGERKAHIVDPSRGWDASYRSQHRSGRGTHSPDLGDRQSRQAGSGLAHRLKLMIHRMLSINEGLSIYLPAVTMLLKELRYDFIVLRWDFEMLLVGKYKDRTGYCRGVYG